MPSREGSIELLRPYVNLTGPDFRLLIVWMAAALRPAGPYPVLALCGDQGSAKSTLARIVRLLIDPQAAPLLGEPRNTRDLMITAVNGWLLAYDNIRALPNWLSDSLCMLATAGAFAAGGSLATDERTVIHAQRPVILNGSGDFVRRGDLSDRAIFLNLPSIAASRRRREDQLWEAFHHDYPRILGGLLDAVAGGLRELPSVEPAGLPRMADFAAFAEAVGRKLGWPAGTVLADYRANRRQATVAQLEDSPLGNFLLDNAHQVNDWTATPAELLADFTRHAGEAVAASPGWPKSPTWLAIELRRIAPQLLAHGIIVRSTRDNHGRVISLGRDPVTAQENHDMA